MGDLISRQATMTALVFSDGMGGMTCGQMAKVLDVIKAVPSAQTELIEKAAYIRGFEQGRTQGMIDTKAEEVAQPNLQQTCNKLATDAISRQAAVEALKGLEFCHYMEFDEYVGEDTREVRLIRAEKAQDALQNLLSVQPERKKGKWIERESGTEDKENGFETVIVCSCCDFPATTFYAEDCESRTQIRTDFCPNCGADMRGKKDE